MAVATHSSKRKTWSIYRTNKFRRCSL